MEYTYEYFDKSARYVRGKIGFDPDIGMILGSGCDPLAAGIEDPVVIPYEEIPNFLRSTAFRALWAIALSPMGISSRQDTKMLMAGLYPPSRARNSLGDTLLIYPSPSRWTILPSPT